MLRPSFAASILSCSLLPCLACTEPPQTCDTACADAGTGTESEDETNETGDGDGDGDGDAGDGDGDGDGDTSSPCDSDTPIVVLETSMGTMVAQLDRVRAPITVDNFTTYVDMGFYDGTIFHRVIDAFVIQGGGYEPGLVLKETLGTIPLEIHPELRHVDGAIGMARSQEPDTAESQFYITDGAQPGLDDNYAVFGVLIDGLAVRDAISMVETLMDVPVTDVVLESAYCVESWP